MWREAGAGRAMRVTCTYFQFGLLCLDWIAVGLLGNTDTGFVGFLLFATCLDFLSAIFDGSWMWARAWLDARGLSLRWASLVLDLVKVWI